MLKKLKLRILQELLWRGNKVARGRDDKFYTHKKEILNRYGTLTHYDLQFIHGKKCYTCNGTGKYYCDWIGLDYCDNCGGTGWYKPNRYTWLKAIRFGKYNFHLPVKSVHKCADGDRVTINGYVEHTPVKYSKLCYHAIRYLYEGKNYIVEYWNDYNNVA